MKVPVLCRTPNQIGLLAGRSIHFRIFLAHAAEVGLRRLVPHVQLGGDLLGAVARDVELERIQLPRAELRARLREVAIRVAWRSRGMLALRSTPMTWRAGIHDLAHRAATW